MSVTVKTIAEITATATDPSGTTYIPISQDGTTKKIEADDFIKYAVPIGSVQMFAGATAPTNWFFCNGSAIARSTYSVLFTVIGTTWGTGDGSNTFNIPDMRESAPVAPGTSASSITSHDVFTLAQFKDDQLQGHEHTGAIDDLLGAAGTARYVGSTASVDGTKTFDMVSDDTNGTPRFGTVTRGKRIGINFIIKAL